MASLFIVYLQTRNWWSVYISTKRRQKKFMSIESRKRKKKCKSVRIGHIDQTWNGSIQYAYGLNSRFVCHFYCCWGHSSIDRSPIPDCNIMYVSNTWYVLKRYTAGSSVFTILFVHLALFFFKSPPHASNRWDDQALIGGHVYWMCRKRDSSNGKLSNMWHSERIAFAPDWLEPSLRFIKQNSWSYILPFRIHKARINQYNINFANTFLIIYTKCLS